MQRKFMMFYKNQNTNSLGHVWIYGEEDLKKEIKMNEQLEDYEILQVIEIFDYKEIDIDDFE